MMCSDVRKRLPELALGDLDIEPAAEVRAHLSTCDSCRAAEGALHRTVTLLKVPPALSPSTGRRSAAVAAMARAHAEQAERLLARPRRRWAPWVAAAAAFLVLVVAPQLRLRGGSMAVASLSGRADLLDRSSGTWHPLAVGAKVAVGDRLVTQPGCVVELSAGPHLVWLDQETSVDLVDSLSVALDRGRLCVRAGSAPGSPIRVSDTANNVVEVLSGRVEIGLREVQTMVGGSRESRQGEMILPAARTLSSRRLTARVADGIAELRGAQDQRLRAASGQSGTFDFGGQPAAAASTDGAVAPWAGPGSDRR
ncbi:MAG TPA: zf-HC2 domain-containing protein [Planctomycetota bacterium]|nr:zf-HC2 domain-containing protein [Planctomycetota bacterium]